MWRVLLCPAGRGRPRLRRGRGGGLQPRPGGSGGGGGLKREREAGVFVTSVVEERGLSPARHGEPTWQTPRKSPSPNPGTFRSTSWGCRAATSGGCRPVRSEEPTSELQSLMRHSYAVFCLKTQTNLH